MRTHTRTHTRATHTLQSDKPSSHLATTGNAHTYPRPNGDQLTAQPCALRLCIKATSDSRDRAKWRRERVVSWGRPTNLFKVYLPQDGHTALVSGKCHPLSVCCSPLTDPTLEQNSTEQGWGGRTLHMDGLFHSRVPLSCYRH